jgi:hypothetical protein
MNLNLFFIARFDGNYENLFFNDTKNLKGDFKKQKLYNDILHI